MANSGAILGSIVIKRQTTVSKECFSQKLKKKILCNFRENEVIP
jgi:hypothetical protein